MILIGAPPSMNPSRWREGLASHFSDDQVFGLDDFEPARIRYLVAWKPEPELFAALPALEVIFSLGAGVDHLLNLPSLPDLPLVRVINHHLTEQMVGYIVWRVLALHRRDDFFRAAQANKRWLDDEPSWEAADLSVGILGLGHLGRAAGDALQRLGFTVHGWSRSPQDVPGITCHHGGAGLTGFLGKSHVLVALLPHTPETEGIINTALIDKLARGGPLGAPALINAGRGALQVEADILAALDRGALSHAALDVFAAEPLPEQSPLWEHPRVLITPHAAAASSPASIGGDIAEIIKDHQAGRPLRQLVDRDRGY